MSCQLEKRPSVGSAQSSKNPLHTQILRSYHFTIGVQPQTVLQWLILAAQIKCCPSRMLLTLRASEALQFENTSAIPSERDDPPIEFASCMCHSVFICTGTPSGIDKAMEHRSFSAAYLMVSL